MSLFYADSTGRTPSFPHGAPCWIDLGSTDPDAAARFYSELFQWTVDDLGPDAGGYRMLRRDGRAVAGLGQATDPARGSSWAVYFATDDLPASTDLVGKLGGTVVVPPMDVMEAGRMAVCQDAAGGYFSLWQAGQHRGSELVGADGSVGWVELFSTDLAGVTGFYEEVLGATSRTVRVQDLPYLLFESGGRAVAGGLQITPDMGDFASAWIVNFTVADAYAAADRAIALGGRQEMREEMAIGRVAWIVDPTGGAFCLVQPNRDFTV